MKFYYVYILLCSDGLTYTGITDNIARRINEHQNGLNKNSFTYRRRPVKLIFQQEFNDVLQAIYFEKKIKKWSAKKKMALADGDVDLLQNLAMRRNASHYKYNPEQDRGLDCDRPDSPSTALDRTSFDNLLSIEEGIKNILLITFLKASLIYRVCLILRDAKRKPKTQFRVYCAHGRLNVYCGIDH